MCCLCCLFLLAVKRIDDHLFPKILPDVFEDCLNVDGHGHSVTIRAGFGRADHIAIVINGGSFASQESGDLASFVKDRCTAGAGRHIKTTGEKSTAEINGESFVGGTLVVTGRWRADPDT